MDLTLQGALDERRQQHLYRQRSNLNSRCAATVMVDGKSQHNFCSNDYLGLAGHPDIAKALQQGADEYGTGSGASHLISGHSQAHEQLEQELAEFTGRPRALLFSTGYMANMGVISALLGRRDLVLQDRLNHASLLDGGLLSRADLQRYKHANTDDLAARLRASNAERKLVVTDGVFSMDGDLPPLEAMATVTNQHQGWLMVDDAHGFGVLGKNGGGLIEALDLSIDQVPILVGTLGKAFGTFGAFVAGSEALIETLIQFSRSYIYTTALPPAVAVASSASLKILQAESWRREKLVSLVSRFRLGAEQIGLDLMDSQTPIQPVQINNDQRVMEINQQLRAKGFMVGAIRPPTVPKGSGRLRICLSATHTEQQIDQLLEALESVGA
ncbi:8-amino-7-oxononanoate synthase [Porticoccaceae bacterium]|nr:8-amino-7-oxononanoate synthase [Porticoccaceae bacterium]MDB4077065.1 8-amino-7-oxononanoate synthase [Porticoccaceae bacterium]